MKKPINTRLHGFLDYMVGFALILPWLSNYFTFAQDTWLITAVGAMTIVVSLFTNYEMGLVKIISMPVHLVLDVMGALVLMALPFIYPLHHYNYYWPVLVGAGEIIIVILSSAKSYRFTKDDLNIINR